MSEIYQSRIAAIHASAAGEKAQLMRKATVATLCGVGFLVVVKIIAWLATDSLALMSSLVDSGMDMLASLTNFFAIRYALVPPDEEHRFGHGKVEYIGGMGQAVFIAITAGFVLSEGVFRLMRPVPVESSAIGLGVMVLSMLVTVGIIYFQKQAIDATDSTAVKADYLHYAMDLFSNFAVLVALVLVWAFDWLWADPLFAILVSLYILKGAYDIGKISFNHLMDREFEDDEREAIKHAVRAVEGVKGMHDLKTRRSGLLSFIQLAIYVDGKITLEAAHDITEAAERAVAKLYPHAEVFIHTDPL